MGLDVSHDAWHGAYSAFHRFRKAVAKAVGIDLERMEGFMDDFTVFQRPELKGTKPVAWASLSSDPIHVFLNHSDCDGVIAVEHLIPLAERLEAIIPVLETMDKIEMPGGHLDGPPPRYVRGYAGAAKRFADGCRRAAAENEPLDFH